MRGVPRNLSTSKMCIQTDFWHQKARGRGGSPCEDVDLNQRHVEPLLFRHASDHNSRHRFSTVVVGVETAIDRLGVEYILIIQDHIKNHHFGIRTTYVHGADGGPNHIARSFGFTFSTTPRGAKACKILIRAEFRHFLTEKSNPRSVVEEMLL